jgi:hypothetical protein
MAKQLRNCHREYPRPIKRMGINVGSYVIRNIPQNPVVGGTHIASDVRLLQTDHGAVCF